MVPRLPYFLTKCDKKRFVDLLNGTVGFAVDAEVGVVCSASTWHGDIKCTVKTILKINFNNVNVILLACVVCVWACALVCLFVEFLISLRSIKANYEFS